MRTCDDQSASESSPIAQMHAPSAVEKRAEALFAANLAAIRVKQPKAAAWLESRRAGEAGRLSELTFLYGRDGSLTARDDQGRWWAGTSLPLHVGQSLMKTLELNGPVGCLLAPASAGLVRAVLERTEASHAIIAVIPDALNALVALHCEDFSAAVSADRLWLAAGENWPEELEELLEAHPGLCIPRQYIRTPLQDDAEIGALIELANPAFARQANRRIETMEQMRLRREAEPGEARGILSVVAGSRFVLSNLAGPAMAEVLCGGGGLWERLDISRPISSSPAALAEAAMNSDAIIAADLFRGDIPGCAANEVPWITWATRGRIMPPADDAPRDALLLADERRRKDARAAGWPASRIFAAGWPMLNIEEPKDAELDGRPLALIADAADSKVPDKLKNFSSQSVLWEQIGLELEQNPFALGEEIASYLAARMAQLEIDAGAVDGDFFAEHLILPSWRRGILRAMLRAGLRVWVYGKGWDDGEFASIWRGPIAGLNELRKAAASASALIHPDPAGDVHAISALGRPVVRPRGLLKNGRRALPGGQPAFKAASRLSRELILSVLRRA